MNSWRRSLSRKLFPTPAGQAPAARSAIRSRPAAAHRALDVAVSFALMLAMGVSLARAEGGDAAAGRKKAIQCAVCHGIDGKAKIPEAPNLAGQNEIYLVSALGAYKSGARKNEMMSLVAPNLSDQDVADLAAYYASLGAAAPK